MQSAYHIINKTGIYSLALKERQKKLTTDQTWMIFKQVFAEEYYDRVKETKVASGDASFHLANAMQYIGGALDHLTMAAVA